MPLLDVNRLKKGIVKLIRHQRLKINATKKMHRGWSSAIFLATFKWLYFNARFNEKYKLMYLLLL